MAEPPYGTRIVIWTDELGRRLHMLIPKDAPDDEAPHGLLLGPPDLSTLGWPSDVVTELHNQLEARGIITSTDAQNRPDEIVKAVQRAWRASAQAVQALYLGGG